MARSQVGAGLTEKYYRRTRLLSLALATVLRGLWEGLGLAKKETVPAPLVKRWLDAVVDIINEFRELSLAMAHDYFIEFVAVDTPEIHLNPMGGQRAVWSGLDVKLDDDLEALSKVMINGRVAQIPDAAEKVVQSSAVGDEFEVQDLAEVKKVMGDDWGEYDGEAGDDPLTLMPDPYPLDETNVRNRMLWKGPKGYEKKAQEIQQLTRVNGDDTPDALEETKKIRMAKQADKSWVRSTNAAVTLADAGQGFVAAAATAHAMGYVRALGPNPCAFCVMLAAQGVVYEKGAWDESNARFRTWTSTAGTTLHGGSAKVHDGCQCRLEPVSMIGPDVQLPPSVTHAQKLWEDATGRFFDISWQEKVNIFRRAYHDGELDKDYLNNLERDMLSTERDELRLTIPNLMMHLAHMELWEQETGEDMSMSKDFYREQLDYRLQRWNQKGYGETDWTKEYEWTIARAAAVWTHDTYEDGLAEFDELIAEGGPAAHDLEINKHFMQWVHDQAPEALDEREKYWSMYVGPVTDEAVMFDDPKMPEFN